MMQDVSKDKSRIESDVKIAETNKEDRHLSPSLSASGGSPSNFCPDMSGSDEGEASEVDSFILDENDMDGGEVLESSNYDPKFLLTAETEEGQQQLQTVDPETHARLEALLEAAGISKLSSKDGKALTDPEVLRTLTSSVSSALDEATQAINCMRSEQQSQLQGTEGAQALGERDSSLKRNGTFVYESGSVPDTTEEGESLLSLACSAGYYELAQVLLAMNANVEDRGIKGDCTPLMEAAAGGYVDIVRLLLLHGADVNAQSSAGNTPLHSAACAGHTNVVKELIDNGASVEVHNENGHTPLMEAASAGHVDIAELLLGAGAGINTHSNEFKESALTLACYKGHLQMVKYLLDAGADQEHKTDEMHTALMEASMDGHVEVARLLLDSGAQVNMPADSFESPLTLAACGGHVELANLLIERGANIEEVNDEGYTPLMEAAREGHDEMVALLLSHGADINAQTEETQETALTLACCGGFQDVVKLLIKAGADIELGCSTPLMEAAQEGHKDLVKFLLENSANVHAQTGTNDTALTYACENGHTDVASLLLKHGAFLEHESEGGRTPLMKAARAGHLCTVKFLVSRGADVNRATSTNDHTVLSLACAGGHQQVVEYLLASGADANHKLKDGSTMIIEAAKGGHTNVVKLLLEWPSRLMLSSSELAQPDTPHMSLAQGAIEEPRVPVQGLAHIVPPNDPNSELHAAITANVSQGKGSERQIGGKILGKRTLPLMPGSGSVDGKTGGKSGSSVIAENLQQIPHEGTVLADLTDEKATEKVEALINNIMAKELLGPGVGSKEEQLHRKQQILEELQKVEKELKEKAQAQQQMEQQQQHKPRSGSGSTPLAVRQAEETAKKVMELNVAAGATGVQRGLAESLCLTGNPAMDSLPLKDLVVQLPKLLSSPDLAAATQSLIPNPAFSLSDPFLQNPASVALPTPPSTVISNGGGSAPSQMQSPLSQFSQQPLSTTAVTSGYNSGKASKGRGNAGKSPRSNKSSQQHPLPPPPPQQHHAHPHPPITTTHQPLHVLPQQMEHNPGFPLQHGEQSGQTEMQVSSESLQQQQLAILTQQQHLQQLTFPHLTSQQQEQLLQHMLSQQVLQQQPFQTPLHQFVPQSPGQQGQPMLTQQEHAQFLQQTQQARALQQQLLKQTATSTPAVTSVTVPNPSAVAVPPLPAEKAQGSLYPSSLDVDSQTESNHDTALTLACAGGHSELVSLLLAKGADIEHRDKKGFTPLILAATAGHQEVVEILLDHGADIEAQSERTKDTPLSLACSGGRFEVVELLLTRGANKEHRNVSDYTPLSLAASGGYVNIIKLLLSQGAEINSRTGSKLGISPLMLAAMNGHTQAVKLLLDMGSDINAQIETNRNTALTLACFQGRHEVVSLLVDRKANIEHRAKTGLTPLMEAASGGYVEVGRVLLEKGADVNAPPVPSSRDTALTIAADKGHYRFVELLLHRKSSVDVKNKKGDSPLWLACNGGHLDVVQLLVSAGADIDSQDNRKVSCLMAAFRRGHIKVVKWMVRNVTQFPSDTELQRFVSAAADKELQKKCQQCMDIIVSAKDRQAAEANKNASILLQEIDRERELDEQKKQMAAKRREKKKERKKKGKQDKKDGKEKNSSPEPDSEYGMEKGQVDEDEEDEKLSTESLSGLITATVESPVITTSESKIVKSNGERSSISVISQVSKSASSHAHLRAERRMNAELRKNQRNRKLLEAQGLAREISEGQRKSSSVSTSCTLSSVVGSTPMQSITSIGESPASSISLANSSNTRRRRNDLKSSASVKTRVGDLDDFGCITLKSPYSERYAFKNLEKARVNDLLNLADHDTLVAKVATYGTSPRKGQRKDEGWKEVTRKTAKRLAGPNDRVQPSSEGCKHCGSDMNPDPQSAASGTASYECCNCRSKKVVVPTASVSKVIGRGGCNINSIREASGAHVDIEKAPKNAPDRTITIKGPPEATRLANAMITSLVTEPEKDLSEIIAKLKGRQGGEKSQQTPATIGDFAIGMFTVPTTSSQSGNSTVAKSSSAKSGGGRQSAGSGTAVNGRSSTGNSTAPINVWQNPTPGSVAPPSPRRSPLKQLPPSLLQTSVTPYQDKSSGRQLHSCDRHTSSVTPNLGSVTISFDTATTSSKVTPTAMGMRGVTESRQSPTAASSPVAGAGAKGTRQSSGNVRVLHRQTPPNARSEPQPLPIVSSHMPSPSSNPVATVISIPATSSASFSTFHLWNPSPTPTLVKKEDFASVAAAGVILNQPSQLSDKAAVGEPVPAKNDPSKAPGYKAGLRTASPQLRQEQVSISAPLAYSMSEAMDLPRMSIRGPLPGMPVPFGMPSPAGDGSQIPHPISYLGHPEHLNSAQFPLSHPSVIQSIGPELEQKNSYSSPAVPMTLPEIKSSLNPNAPDFRLPGSGGMINLTSNFPNGYPQGMEEVGNGGDMMQGSQSDATLNNGMDAFIPFLLANSTLNHLGGQLTMEHLNTIVMQMRQQSSMQRPMVSSGPGASGQSPMSRGMDGPPGSISMSQPIYMGPQASMSGMPGIHRPSSAPSMPDSAATTPLRANNMGPSMPSRTPPMSDGKQTPESRFPLPIGGERAARKLPLNCSTPPEADYMMNWGTTESGQKDWLPAAAPHSAMASLSTSVSTSSVVVGGNMATGSNMPFGPPNPRDSPAHPSDNMNVYADTFQPLPFTGDSAGQGPSWRNWSSTD